MTTDTCPVPQAEGAMWHPERTGIVLCGLTGDKSDAASTTGAIYALSENRKLSRKIGQNDGTSQSE
jgi:hypothetical protein